MSEQSTNGPTTSNAPTITSGVKEKDPCRVAAGKRLGAISRQAKEAKRLEREAQAQQSEETEVENNTDNKYTSYFVGGLVVVGTVSYLYLNKDKLTNQATRSNQRRLPTIPEEEEPPPKKSNRVFAE